jgi:hypothetical protein
MLNPPSSEGTASITQVLFSLSAKQAIRSIRGGTPKSQTTASTRWALSLINAAMAIWAFL